MTYDMIIGKIILRVYKKKKKLLTILMKMYENLLIKK